LTTLAPVSPEAQQLLRQKIQYAYRNLVYYQQSFDDAGVDPASIQTPEDLQALPMVSKEQIIFDQKAHPPFGTLAGDASELTRINLIASTYYMCFSRDDQARMTGMFAEAFRTLGVRPGDIVDLASAFHWVMAGTQMDAALRELGAAVVPSGPGQTEQRIRVIHEVGVTAIQAFTPYAEELAIRCQEQGIDPQTDLGVRLLMVGGELRDSAAKARLEAAWGGAVAREFYGASEAGMAAAECFEVGDGMHLGSHCIVEVVDPETGRAVAPGAPGEIVTTELVRSLQPFIRYRTGDITEGLCSDPCACGRTSWRLGRILGRNSEIARVKGLFIAPAVVDQVVRRLPQACAWGAIVERPGTMDSITVRVEWAGGADGRDAVASDLVRHLKDAVGITCAVELVEPETIDVSLPRIQDLRDFR
jgi:phenylacetate-CoA ligase